MEKPTKEQVRYWFPAVVASAFGFLVVFEGPVWDRLIYSVVIGFALQAVTMLLYVAALAAMAQVRGVEIPKANDDAFTSGMLAAVALVTGLWIWNQMSNRSYERWLVSCLANSDTIDELHLHHRVGSRGREEGIAWEIDWCEEQRADMAAYRDEY